jgi:hypothetical protein
LLKSNLPVAVAVAPSRSPVLMVDQVEAVVAGMVFLVVPVILHQQVQPKVLLADLPEPETLRVIVLLVAAVVRPK